MRENIKIELSEEKVKIDNVEFKTSSKIYTGKGNYKGTVTKTFTIKAINGWVTKNGKKYYYKNNNTLKGWIKIGGTWYYMLYNGKMVTGKQSISGKTYYFDKNGKWIK